MSEYHFHLVFEVHEGTEESSHKAVDAMLDALEAQPGTRIVDARYGDNDVCHCDAEEALA